VYRQFEICQFMMAGLVKKKRLSARSCPRKFFEWIEDFQTGPSEVPVVAGDNSEPMSQGRCGDVAVLDGHPLARFIELMLQVGPDVRHRDVEAANSPLHGLNQSREPFLEEFPLPSLFRADPVR
jgi:hypothetical protein